MVDAFRQSLSFHVVSWPTDKQPEQAFTSNKARGALIIPEDFGRSIARGENATVQMLVDASDGNTAQIISGDAQQIVRAYNAANARRHVPQPVTAAIRLWYNPSRSSQKFYGPGIFVLAMSLFPPLAGDAGDVQRRRAENNPAGLRLKYFRARISARQNSAFMIVASGEAIIMMTILFTGFGLRFAGDPTPFIVATILYMFCVTAFGNMLGAAIPSQVAAMQAVALTGFLLVYMLSGLAVPDPKHSRWHSLDFQHRLGPLLH